MPTQSPCVTYSSSLGAALQRLAQIISAHLTKSKYLRDDHVVLQITFLFL